MTENDYILSLMAIVSGLAITHMIASLYGLLAQRTVVRFDWLALMAAALTGYIILYGWWVTWAGFHSRTGPLPFWRFLMPMMSVTALVMAARAALPDRVPEEGIDLRTRYDENGVWIWRALLVSACITSAGLALRRFGGEHYDASAAPWGFTGLITTGGLFAVLSFTKDRRVHMVLVPALIILFIAATWRQPV